MVPDSSSSFISKELGCNIYSLKTSAEEKFMVLRPTRLSVAPYVSQTFLHLEIITRAGIRVDEDCFITK